MTTQLETTAQHNARVDLAELYEEQAERLGLEVETEIDETWGDPVAYLVLGESRYRVEVADERAIEQLSMLVPNMTNLEEMIEGICAGYTSTRQVRAYMRGREARLRNLPIDSFCVPCEWSQYGWDDTAEALGVV